VKSQLKADAVRAEWKQARVIIEEMAQIYKVSVDQILNYNRNYPLPLCRRMTALKIHNELGWGPSLIGIVLHRNHSTVIHMLRKEGIKSRKKVKK